MKNKKIVLLSALLFLLFVNLSYSLEDFNAYLNQQFIEICECSEHHDTITIENAGDELSNYRIIAQGALKENVILSKEVISLSPNERIEINYALTEICGKTGNYELIFDISRLGITKRISIPVSIKKCNNIELKTKKNVETICPCTLVKYQLELKNTGSFTENYLLDINKPFKKWTKLSAEKITLSSGQETILDFYIRPECGVYGNYSSIFKIVAEKTNLAAKMPLYLHILPCYDYNITLGRYYVTEEEDIFLFKEHYGDYNLCEKEEKTVPVLIENKAPIPNRFDIELKGEEWAKLDKKRIIINAKNSTIVHLIMEPPEKLRENYTFLIEAETYWGNIKQKKEFNVSVDLCYTPFIKTDQITVNYTKSTRQIEIQNLGVKKADYYFEIIEKPDWVNVEQLNITILPNEVKTINLISEPAEEIRQGNYNLVINTTAQNGVGYEDVVVIKLRKKGVLSKAYEKTKELVKGYGWYLLGGLAGLIVLLVVISLIRRTLIERKELRKIEEEKEPEIKEEVKKKPKKEIKKPKIRLWKYLAVFVVVLLVLFAFSYTLIPEVFKGNFTAITTLYPSYPEEEINVTEVPVEEPELRLSLKERIYSYGKGFVEMLKSYSYYIGFGILALIFLIIVIRFVRKKKYEEAGIEEKIKEKPLKEKKKEAKKAEKKKVKKKTGFYHILKILLLALVAAILIFAMSYFKNYIMYFINYIIAGIAALVLLILIITLSKNKKAKKHFKKKWKSYFLILVLVLVLFGVYMTYQNKYYEGPCNKTKEWFSEINSKLKDMAYVPLVENVSEEVEEAEEEEEAEEIVEEAVEEEYEEIEEIEEAEEEEEQEEIEEEIEEIEEEEIVEGEIEEEETVEEEYEEIEEEEAVISWDQNSDYILDLKKYFHDPDDDKLYFSSSALKNIDIEVNDEGIAVMNPRRNWYGREKVVFTADDNKGGIVKSDEITLVVKESEDQTYLTGLLAKTKNFFSLYSYYIIAGIAVLVAALFLLRIFEGDNNKNKRKNRKNKKSKL